MPDLVTLTIDDKQVTVPANTLVVDAAKAAGIDIPVFCSHRKLDPLGACRMCLVEFVGPRGSRLDTSCTVRVSEGMVVRTHTDQVKAVREANLGFILLNHPLDCPICDKGGECPLQDQTMEYGPGFSRFIEPKRRKQKHYPISDLIMLDQERCILCWRCIRYLQEWEDKPQLGLFERGGETIIDIFPGKPVDAKTSGSIVDICPVGALTNRVARFRYRPWELKKTPSICTLCPVGCATRLDERVHELRRIVARENSAVNDDRRPSSEGWICDKGRFLHQYVDHPDRLAQPLIRKGGELRPATWDEALDQIVEAFEATASLYGARSIGGVASAGISNEAAYLFQKFFRALLGTNNVDFPTGSAVSATSAGLSAISDIAASDLIVLVSLDPSEATPVLALHIKRALLRAGSRLLAINPRRIELARYASDPRVKPGAYLPARPGTEALVLNGLASAVLAQLTPNAPRPSAPEGPVRTHHAPRTTQAAPRATPQEVESGTGVAVADLGAAAQILMAAKSPLFLYGPGAATGERGRATVAALNNLAVLLGHGDKLSYIGLEANSQGARDMGLLPDMLPGHQVLQDTAVRERLGKLWGTEPPAEPGLSYGQMLDGGVRALYVVGANPGAAPAVAAALRNLDFLVVQDLFLTETAQLADVVLPATSFAEADGTYTNLERRVQRAPQAIQPHAASRPDWVILTALDQRWLARQAFGDPLRRFSSEAHEVPAQSREGTATIEPLESDTLAPEWKKRRRRSRQGPIAKPWDYPDAQAVLEEIGKAVPVYAGVSWEALGTHGIQWQVASAALALFPHRVAVGIVEAEGLGTSSSEGHEVSAQSRPKGAVIPIPAPPAGSFWLVSGPALWDAGTFMQHAAEEICRLIPEPFVSLNPADLDALGLPPGTRVVVGAGSPRPPAQAGRGASLPALGPVVLTLQVDAAVQPGTAWIPAGLAGLPAETLRAASGGEPVAITITRPQD